MGPVLPPSPMLPAAITDLSVIERGDQLVIAFTAPAKTTDNIPVDHLSAIDLRIGVAPAPFDFERWASSAKPYDVQLPSADDAENPAGLAVAKTIDVQQWAGKRIAIAVRTAVKKKEHFSSWSNRVVLDVIPPLTQPVIKAESTAKGVLLTWAAEEPELQFRIYRKTPGSANTLLGTAKTSSYLDASSQYDTPYEYSVVAVKGAAESLASNAVSITTKDIFPPSVPTGVTALAGPNSIELSWQRSPEADLKSYRVYRSVDGGVFVRQEEAVSLPAFSDRKVEHGKTYRYQVSAVDQNGNESERSAEVLVSY